MKSHNVRIHVLCTSSTNKDILLLILNILRNWQFAIYIHVHIPKNNSGDGHNGRNVIQVSKLNFRSRNKNEVFYYDISTTCTSIVGTLFDENGYSYSMHRLWHRLPIMTRSVIVLYHA